MSKNTKSKSDKKRSGQESEKSSMLDEAKFFAGLAVFMLLFFNFVFGHFKIPSESMQPTLEVGDHLYVSKLFYGTSRESMIWPFRKLPLPDGRIFASKPHRGDVVVFRNPKSGIIMIKRLVGLPGDKIQMRHGRLYINDTMVERTIEDEFSYREHRGLVQAITKYKEQLPGEKRPHSIYERNDYYPYDNVGPFIIPEEKLFFMGDNRDNSEDSRAPGGPGFVPFDHVIGKAKNMVYSLHKCEKEQGLRCPPRRFFQKL